MTVHRFGRNGREVVEPTRDEDYPTPEGMAALIGQLVIDGLKPVVGALRATIRSDAHQAVKAAWDNAVADGKRVIEAEMERFARAAKVDVEWLQQQAAAEQGRLAQLGEAHAKAIQAAGFAEREKMCNLVNVALERFAKHDDCIRDMLNKLATTATEARDGVRTEFKKMVGQLKRASVESLTEIIGEEIGRHELNALIREEINRAVRETVRKVLAESLDRPKPESPA